MHITNNLHTRPHKYITGHNSSSPENIETWTGATIITVSGMIPECFLRFRCPVANDQAVGTDGANYL